MSAQQQLEDAAAIGDVDDGLAAIQRGANVGTDSSLTPLCIAVCRGHVRFVAMLIEQGARIDLCDWYPLKVAMTKGQVDVVRLLVHHGHKLKGFCDRLQSFLEHAVGHADMIQIFVDYGYGAIIDKYSSELLCSAAVAGRADMARCMLDSFKADANYFSDSDVMTASHYAAMHDHIHILEILMEHGADLNALGGDKAESVLDFAAKTTTIKWLVEHGVCVTGYRGVKALKAAVIADDLELVQTLLVGGADPLSDHTTHFSRLDKRPALEIALDHPTSPISVLMLSMGFRPRAPEEHPEIEAWYRGEAGPQLERAAVERALNAPDTKHLLPDIDAERLILDFIVIE